MNNYKNVFLAMLFLICSTTVVLAYIAANESSASPSLVPASVSGGDDTITINAALSQNKVLQAMSRLN